MSGTSPFVPDEGAPELTADRAQHLRCFIYGNDDAYELRDIEEVVAVGSNAAIVHIRAAVCRYCGERILDLPNHARLDRVRARVGRGDMTGLEPVGVTYRVS